MIKQLENGCKDTALESAGKCIIKSGYCMLLKFIYCSIFQFLFNAIPPPPHIYIYGGSAKFGLVLTVTYLQIYIHYIT